MRVVEQCMQRLELQHQMNEKARMEEEKSSSSEEDTVETNSEYDETDSKNENKFNANVVDKNDSSKVNLNLAFI